MDRSKYLGFCGMPEGMRIARAALHFWEEPCISGPYEEHGTENARGSGAVFFSGCNLRCVFCQNKEISADKRGREVSPEELADIYLRLQEEKKAYNINLVTGTHYAEGIIASLDIARKKGLSIPVVYNCGGYESVEVIARLAEYVDIYMPDYKYADSSLAERYSGAGDYPEVAFRAIREMVRLKGEAVFDDHGMMQSGVLVRHLILPGYKNNSKAVIEKLYREFGDGIYLSIMSQYTPLPWVKEKYPELSRRITKREYDVVVDYALELGVKNAFIQDRETARESFIPSFDGKDIV